MYHFKMKKITLCLTMLLTVSFGHADVVKRRLESGARSEIVSIEGEIQKSDIELIKKLLPSGPFPVVVLNSSGGDLNAAIELGRYLRSRKTEAIVLDNATCASACVFVLAGATGRTIGGRVVIHRPFLQNDTAKDPAEQKTRYASLGVVVKNYLGEMNVAEYLYDDMLRTPPTQGKTLSRDELEKYGLLGSDPYEDEANRSKVAESLRISKGEYVKRQQQMSQQCNQYRNNGTEEFGKCSIAILYGITRTEYARREKLADKECAKETDRSALVRCQTTILRGF